MNTKEREIMRGQRIQALEKVGKKLPDGKESNVRILRKM